MMTITGVYSEKLSFVVNTWSFTAATDAAFESLLHGGSSLDAVSINVKISLIWFSIFYWL